MSNPYQSPEHGPYREPVQGDATGGIIPYKNMPALIGYYLGVFSLIPAIGLALGPAAIVLGIIGLVYRARNPQARGTAHAWLAIGLGIVGVVAWPLCCVVVPPLLGP